MPGEAEEVGSIVAYLRLDRSDWIRGIRETERDVDRLGRMSPRIRIDTNSTETAARLREVERETNRVGDSGARAGQQFKVGLIPALAAIAPAAVPITAVAGGAMLGLIPVAATLAFGIKGITDEFKSGQLAAGPFGADLRALGAEASTLKTISAGGLLGGIAQALKSSHGLFPEVNADVRDMSNQLGSIVAGAGPALLHILTALNPLFVTFGQLLANGAHHLEDWATHSTGVSSFVAYVQAALPQVMQFLGQVVVLFSHLAQAAAPFGGALLADLNLFVGALNRIPISVLSGAIPVVIAFYAAFKTYQGITAIVNAVSAAVARMSAQTAAGSAAAAASVQASALAEQAAVAEATASEASSRASLAAAVAASQAKIAASLAGTGSVLEEEAAVAAQTSAEEAAAFQLAADQAIAASAEISAAAQNAARNSRVAGAAASTGWSSMLGPIGALLVGGALLATMFLHTSNSAQDAAKAANSYAQSVKESTAALSAVNIAQTNDNLAKNGALDTYAKLVASNHELGFAQSDLTQAVNGSDEQFQALTARLRDVIQNGGQAGFAAAGLLGKITTLRSGLQKQILTQTELNRLNEASVGLTDRQTVAAAALYGLHGTDGVAAYLAAAQAAQKNTDSTKAQTLAFQMENNAAELVNQALATMAGQNLSNAQAQTALGQAVLGVTESLKANGSTTSSNTAKGIANRQAIENAASALRAKMQAEAAATGSTTKATEQYHSNAAALLAQIGRLEGTKSAAYAYAKALLATPPVVKTKAELDKEAAAAKAAAFQRQISGLHGTIVHLQASVSGIDAVVRLKNLVEHVQGGHTVSLITRSGAKAFASGGTVPGAAAGWTVTGPGGPKSDSVLTRLSPGEEVIQEPYATEYRALLKSLNSGVVPAMTMPTAGGGRSGSQHGGMSARGAGLTVAAPNVKVAVYLDGREIDHRADVRIGAAVKTLTDLHTYTN